MPKVTIANGQTDSGAALVRELVGVYIPASFTGTAISFLTLAPDNSTWIAVHSNGVAYSRTVAASSYCPVDPNVFLGIKNLKVKSGSSETGAKELWLVGRA